MGKKRNANGRPFGHEDSRKGTDGGSKLRINTFEDVADSEDEFHINRDKILLEEGPAQKRQRKTREEGEEYMCKSWVIELCINGEKEDLLEPSDEEVLALNEDVSTSDDDFEDAQENSVVHDNRSIRVNTGRLPEDSDSEASAVPEDDEDAGGWGASRQDYYNADTIETEADALEEEAEAKRLQRKQLQGMTEADFGFDEADWLQAGKDDRDEDGKGRGKVIREILPKLEITDAMSPEERLKILRTRYPEFEPLAKEFLELQAVYDDLKTVAAEAMAIKEHTTKKADRTVEVDETSTPMAVIKHSIIAAYLASLSMYFALLTSGSEATGDKVAAMPPDELQDHSIMETLVQCRDLWQKVKDMNVPESNGLHDDDDGGPYDTTKKGSKKKVNGVPNSLHESEDKPKKSKHRKSKAQKALEAAQAEAQAAHAEKMRKTEENLADLSVLTAPSKILSKSHKPLPSTTKNPSDSDSDFGDPTTLTPHEAFEKAQRKKSLRFYTSQIVQKANKRDAAGRDAGGDADLPYRERLKDRQARLNAEAEKRGKKPKASNKSDDVGGPSDDEDYAAAQELRNADGSGEEDYYDLIASRSASKKAAKAAAHAQASQENSAVRFPDENVAEDGKRGISYQIEKNKGIMPKRKKEVRNPRVKKRNKFEAKKKKLGSIRPVWKGGEGRGGYGGEMTGIKSGLIKSVKL